MNGDKDEIEYYKQMIHNLINDINQIKVDYIILNANLTNNQEFISILNQYVNNITDNKEYYRGFIDKKTVYKVADYE